MRVEVRRQPKHMRAGSSSDGQGAGLREGGRTNEVDAQRNKYHLTLDGAERQQHHGWESTDSGHAKDQTPKRWARLPSGIVRVAAEVAPFDGLANDHIW